MLSVAILMLACMHVTHAADDVGGVYQLEGRNPDGTTYAGIVAITARGPVWDVWWDDGGKDSVGVGLLTGNVLSVVYRVTDVPRGPFGLVSYEVGRRDGRRRLVGRWVLPLHALVGAETLTEMDPKYFVPWPDRPRLW